MKLERAFGAVLAACALLAGGCGKPAAPADGVYRLTYRVPFVPDHAQARAAAAWADEVGRRTGGRVRVQVDAAPPQAAAAAVCEQVAQGTADLGLCALTEAGGRFPLLRGVELPLGFRSGTAASRAAYGAAAKYCPRAERGVKLLMAHARGPSVLVSKAPVAGLRDLKGLRVLADGNDAKAVELLGGTAAAVPADGGREALFMGKAGAALCSAAALKERELADAVSCLTDAREVGCPSAFVVVVNQATWKALPAELRKGVEAAGAEGAAWHGQAWDAADAEGLASFARLGRDALTLTSAEQAAWRLRLAPLLQAFEADAAKRGLPGGAVLDALKAAAGEQRPAAPAK